MSVYVSFIILKKCGFVMGFVILAIYFRKQNSFCYFFPLLDEVTSEQLMPKILIDTGLINISGIM